MLVTEWNLENTNEITVQEASKERSVEAFGRGLSQGLIQGLSQGLTHGLSQGALKKEKDLLRALYLDGVMSIKLIHHYAKAMSTEEVRDFCDSLEKGK